MLTKAVTMALPQKPDSVLQDLCENFHCSHCIVGVSHFEIGVEREHEKEYISQAYLGLSLALVYGARYEENSQASYCQKAVSVAHDCRKRLKNPTYSCRLRSYLPLPGRLRYDLGVSITYPRNKGIL